MPSWVWMAKDDRENINLCNDWKMSLTQFNVNCSRWYLFLNSLNNISTCVTNRGLHIVDKDRAVLVTPHTCTLLVPFVHRDITICAQIE